MQSEIIDCMFGLVLMRRNLAWLCQIQMSREREMLAALCDINAMGKVYIDVFCLSETANSGDKYLWKESFITQ